MRGKLQSLDANVTGLLSAYAFNIKPVPAALQPRASLPLSNITEHAQLSGSHISDQVDASNTSIMQQRGNPNLLLQQYAWPCQECNTENKCGSFLLSLWTVAGFLPAEQMVFWNCLLVGCNIHPEGKARYCTLYTQTGLCQLTGFYLQGFFLFFFQAANLQQVLLLGWQLPWISKCQQFLINLTQWCSGLVLTQLILQLSNLGNNNDNLSRVFTRSPVVQHQRGHNQRELRV